MTWTKPPAADDNNNTDDGFEKKLKEPSPKHVRDFSWVAVRFVLFAQCRQHMPNFGIRRRTNACFRLGSVKLLRVFMLR